jgi:hypothetical protein
LAMWLSLERGRLDEDALESSRRCPVGKGLRSILKYTADTFGERQASIYKAKLTDAIAALESGPDAP